MIKVSVVVPVYDAGPYSLAVVRSDGPVVEARVLHTGRPVSLEVLARGSGAAGRAPSGLRLAGRQVSAALRRGLRRLAPRVRAIWTSR